MKKIQTTQEYYNLMDQFVNYINTEVNPRRKKSGLREIGDSEARACFRILHDFEERWKGKKGEQ